LPGFTKKERKINKTTINSYTKYLENKINELNLKHYIIGGISFGFVIANSVNLDKKCKGVFAFEPYTNSKSILFNKITVKFLISLIDTVSVFQAQNTIWKNKLFWKLFSRLHFPEKIIPIVKEEIDPETFFEIGKIILKNTKRIKFHSKPYVVLINKYDDIVSPDYTVNLFKKNVKKLLVHELDSVHYPNNLSEKYFEKIFPPEKVEEVISFFAKNNR